MKPVSMFNTALVAVIAVLTVAAAWWLLQSADDSARLHSGHADQAEHREDDTPGGPHGGRLLTEGPFSIEVTVFERGVPPEFRLYSYYKDQPLAPEDVSVVVELARIDGQVDRFDFLPREDYQFHKDRNSHQ